MPLGPFKNLAGATAALVELVPAFSPMTPFLGLLALRRRGYNLLRALATVSFALRQVCVCVRARACVRDGPVLCVHAEVVHVYLRYPSHLFF